MKKNSLTIDFNGTLRRYGIKDVAVLKLTKERQRIEFKFIKPIINSKRITMIMFPNDEHFYKMISQINASHKAMFTMVHLFMFHA